MSIFYAKHPKVCETKLAYPKVMRVSDEPITKENQGHIKVVFMEKCGKYLAWIRAKTLEEAKTETMNNVWNYAEEIKEELSKEDRLLIYANQMRKEQVSKMNSHYRNDFENGVLVGIDRIVKLIERHSKL